MRRKEDQPTREPLPTGNTWKFDETSGFFKPREIAEIPDHEQTEGMKQVVQGFSELVVKPGWKFRTVLALPRKNILALVYTHPFRNTLLPIEEGNNSPQDMRDFLRDSSYRPDNTSQLINELVWEILEGTNYGVVFAQAFYNPIVSEARYGFLNLKTRTDVYTQTGVGIINMSLHSREEDLAGRTLAVENARRNLRNAGLLYGNVLTQEHQLRQDLTSNSLPLFSKPTQ